MVKKNEFVSLKRALKGLFSGAYLLLVFRRESFRVFKVEVFWFDFVGELFSFGRRVEKVWVFRTNGVELGTKWEGESAEKKGPLYIWSTE